MQNSSIILMTGVGSPSLASAAFMVKQKIGEHFA